jgi:phosphoesterase RecJ-like protein
MTAELDEALERAAAAIAAAPEVALACHVTPDGDALGSMLALHLALRAAGRRSVASFPEPFVVADHYRGLVGLDTLVEPAAFPTAPAVMVTFDAGSIDRLGGLADAAAAATELIVIDHHVSNTRFGTINVIDPQAAASGVVVRRLLAALDLPLDRAVATDLYAALICDTGRFQYESTTPEVFDLARELVAFGLDVPGLSRSLFEEHRFAYLRLMGEAVERMALEPERNLVWTVVTQDMLARHGCTMDEAEGLIDIVRRTREAGVACVLKEDDDGSIKVSLRSVGEVDVCRIATANGGGGHRFAAGFTSHDDLDTTIARIRAAL